MRNIARIPLPTLDGGIDQGTHPAQIKWDRLADLLNFYPWGSQLIKRPGRDRVTTVAGSQVTGLFAFSDSSGWTLVVGQPTGLARKDGTGLTAHTIADGGVYTSATSRWRMRQYNQVGYAVRQSTGRLKRFKSDFMEDAGIDAPGSAVTIAQGAVGDLPAGNYYAVATGYNSDTGIESNPSPVSGVLALGASRKIDYSGIPIFTTGQVNARRLYRTLVNQTGEYFFTVQINNNVDTTYTGENVVTADLGRRVSFRNGLPPTGCLYLEVWKERLWLSDGVSLFFSEEFLPENFYSLSEILPYPDDGHVVRNILAWGDRLVIAKTNAIHYLTGSNSQDFTLQTLSDRHGCVAPESLRAAEGALFWFQGDNFYRALGNSVGSISDTQVRDAIDAIDETERNLVECALLPRYGWYLASIPQGAAGGGFKKTLVYNYRTGAWTIFDYPSSTAPSVLGDFYDANYRQLLYGAFGADGLVWDLSSGNTDEDNAAISGLIRPRRLGIGSGPDQMFGKLFGMVGGVLLCDRSTGTATVRCFRDGAAAALKSRTISLDKVDEWKPFNLSSMEELATTLDFEFVHSGTDGFKIQAMRLDLNLPDREAQAQ